MKVVYLFSGLLILSVISSPLAWSFSYPNSAATPEREKSVGENLFQLYNSELRELKKAVQGDPKSSSNLKLISSKIKLRNKKVLEELQKENQEDLREGARGLPFLRLDQAQKILDTVASHPVVGDSAFQKYDRDGLNVGFCFGRAAYIHIELLRRGLDPLNMGKVFAIGKFRFGKAVWDFHVATVARGPNNEWWAIDPVTSKKVEPVDIWMSKVEKLCIDPNHPLTRYYFSDAVKFHPLYGAYGPDNLYFPYFNHYFVDLAKWFDSN